MPLSQTWRWSGQTNRIGLCFAESRDVAEARLPVSIAGDDVEGWSSPGLAHSQPDRSRPAVHHRHTPNSKRPTTNLMLRGLAPKLLCIRPVKRCIFSSQMVKNCILVLRRRRICTSEVTAVLPHLSPLRLRLVPLDASLDFLLPIRAKPDHSVFTESNDEESDDLPYSIWSGSPPKSERRRTCLSRDPAVLDENWGGRRG